MEEAADYAQALAACQRHEPDVALVSKCIESPRGGSLLDELKAHPEVFSTAVVLVAPEEMPFAQAQELLGRGAADLLIEPVHARGGARARALGHPHQDAAGGARRPEPPARDAAPRGPADRASSTAATSSPGSQGLISGARRHGRQLSVAMIDIDRFKGINDEYGHDAGDRALVEITSALRDRLRAEDELGRLGGEEFLALLPDTGGARPPGWPRTCARASGGAGALPRARARRDGQHRLGGLGRRGGPGRAGQTGRRRALRSQGRRAQRRAGSRESLC